MKRLMRFSVLLLINNFLSFTRFFKLKRVLLRMAGIKVGSNTKVVGPVYIGFQADLEIGDDCWIGSNLNILGNGCVKIGDRCDIAPELCLITGSHKYGNINRRAGEGIDLKIEIKSGVWIGARVTILGTILIDDSSVIGAGALVNSNLDANGIFVGVPARLIKKFNES